MNFIVFGQEDFLGLTSNKDSKVLVNEIDSLNKLAFKTVISDPKKGREIAYKANELSLAIYYPKGLARSYSIIGNSYWSVGVYDVALKNYYESIKIYDSINDIIGVANSYNNIGEVFRQQEKYDKALEYLTLALDTYNKSERKTPPIILFNNLGESLIELGQYDSAEFYFRKIINLEGTDNETKRKIAYGYHNMARTNFHKQNYHTGLNCIKKAIDIRTEINDVRGLSTSYSLQGDLYASIYHFNTVNSYHKSLSIASKINALDLQKDVYKKLSSFYEKHEEYDSSLIYYKKLMDINARLFDIEKSNKVTELTAKYQSEKKDQEFLLLKKQNAMVADTNKSQRQFILIIGSIGLIMLISLIKLFFNHKKIRKYNEELSEKNKEIKIQHEEIEVQAEELKSLNEMQSMLNYDLEKKINDRTSELREMNRTLAKYAFYNAHKLRAPVASILGLVDLILRSDLTSKEYELVINLKKSADNLDATVHEIKDILEDEERKKQIKENELE
ncbi:tetratricopeptide repeat protein [Marinigracilibium pacificum]|uniref:Sensor histidine kinase n=1 Tax=Marinigracilibium pacificum TaxID=2729599 RepID=A0A848IY61_9BACT|nr:sensor histidine kinase [Marinigracilibium pacificum]